MNYYDEILDEQANKQYTWLVTTRGAIDWSVSSLS